jgi:NH3-dependent NAD+ synthetase
LLDKAPAHEGAQDAAAQNGLYLGHSGGIDSTGRVKDDARHFLKHPIDRAHMEVHMPVQAGAEPVDKGQRANVLCCLAQYVEAG